MIGTGGMLVKERECCVTAWHKEREHVVCGVLNVVQGRASP
jgi:hypothetical protein